MRQQHKPPDPILRTEGVSVRLGGRAVIDGASFEVRRGELVALVGPNGAGKTTLLRALAGLVGSAGDIWVDGGALEQFTPRERARMIAYLPQGHVFHWPITGAAAIALGRHPHADVFGRQSDADRSAVARAMAATATVEFAERSVLTLSGGERARIVLARALATEAPLLLADEPTASLDPRHQLIVMAQLREQVRRGGAVLAVTHDLAHAARFADRVLVMDCGRLVADAAPAEALSTAIIADVFGVEAIVVQAGDEQVPVPRRPL